MDKLLQVIYFIVKNQIVSLDRISLAKLIYYSDGVFFQRNQKIITGEKYIHLENSPQPARLNEALLFLVEKSYLKVEPGIGNNESKIPVFYFKVERDFALDLGLSEMRKIRKVIYFFKGGVVDESKVFPNLYENYVITPLYSEIKFNESTINTKIHIHKKRRFMDVSGRFFRIIYHP